MSAGVAAKTADALASRTIGASARAIRVLIETSVVKDDTEATIERDA
jgi:hypothetical protein